MSEPGCLIGLISDERWGAAMGDEVALGAHGAFPLSMGTKRREDRGE